MLWTPATTDGITTCSTTGHTIYHHLLAGNVLDQESMCMPLSCCSITSGTTAPSAHHGLWQRPTPPSCTRRHIHEQLWSCPWQLGNTGMFYCQPVQQYSLHFGQGWWHSWCSHDSMPQGNTRVRPGTIGTPILPNVSPPLTHWPQNGCKTAAGASGHRVHLLGMRPTVWGDPHDLSS